MNPRSKQDRNKIKKRIPFTGGVQTPAPKGNQKHDHGENRDAAAAVESEA